MTCSTYIVSTDVLAEGVNLQQARHIINYDLPWNPMRLVCDTAASTGSVRPHSPGVDAMFHARPRLDALFRLEDRLHRKIKQAARSIGIERP